MSGKIVLDRGSLQPQARRSPTAVVRTPKTPRSLRRAFASRTTSFGPKRARKRLRVTPSITKRARKRLRADSGDRQGRAEALPRRILKIGSTSRSASGPTWEISEVVQKRFRAEAGDRQVTQAALRDESGARPRALGSDSRGRCCRGGHPTTERRVAAEVVEALRARGDHHARLGDPSRRGTGSMG